MSYSKKAALNNFAISKSLFFNKVGLFSADVNCCTNTIKTFALHNSKTKCHLKMKFGADAYFYETFCLRINWNLHKVPLRLQKKARCTLSLNDLLIKESALHSEMFAQGGNKASIFH